MGVNYVRKKKTLKYTGRKKKKKRFFSFNKKMFFIYELCALVPLSRLTVAEYSRNECRQGEEKILIKSKFCIDSDLYIRQKVK